MFSEELEKYPWDDTTRQIYSKTATDVEIALGKSHLNIEDFMALISPAAEKYLEPMAALSPPIYLATVRENHIHVYSPLPYQLLYEFLCILRF